MWATSSAGKARNPSTSLQQQSSSRRGRRGGDAAATRQQGPTPTAAGAPYPTPPRKAGFLLPGACLPRRGRSLAAWTQTALPAQDAVPFSDATPVPDVCPHLAPGLRGQRVAVSAGSRERGVGALGVSHTSERGARTPTPEGGGQRLPGSPPSPARPHCSAQGPPAAGARSRSRSRSRARGGLRGAAMPAARCGRARSLRAWVCQPRRPPARARARFAAAGGTHQARGGERCGRSHREPGAD